MIRTISSYLNINPSHLEKLGVFDASIDLDTKLFLDPHLLKKTRIPEFSKSRAKMLSYYDDVICLINSYKNPNDRAWNTALNLLKFKEIKEVSIGYGHTTNAGNAIGVLLAGKLLHSAIEIVTMGIKDPQIFELIGLFEDGFGADRISDMTISIIYEDILKYSQRITKTIGTEKTITYTYCRKTYTLIKHPDRAMPLLLLPQKLLRDLPIALSWDGIDYVVQENKMLRDEINKTLGESWKKKVTKPCLKQIFFKDKQYIEGLLKAYDSANPCPYDFENDPLGEVAWRNDAAKFSSGHPLTLKLSSTPGLVEVKSVVKQIIVKFKSLIESNGLDILLYANHKPRHERHSQRLFYGIASAYCETNNLDLSAEPNAGPGPVDFKMSSGFTGKVLVEIKLSTNNLIHGFDKQLPIYQEGERTKEAFYVVLKVSKTDDSIKRLLEHRNSKKLPDAQLPEIIVIDGTIKPSASKR